jgi:hypothetical protein
MPYITTHFLVTNITLNFLSHYYFERYTSDSYQVLGALLPDLLKNADKNNSVQIQKYESDLMNSPQALALTRGWKRHLEVDKIFHNTDFFYFHTHQLRKEIENIIVDLPVRASFLAHIGLELLLDHILIDRELISVSRLYEHLEHVDKAILKSYLMVFTNVNQDVFFHFFDRFVASKYIFEYAKIENLPYAMFKICKRIWSFEVDDSTYRALAEKLEQYRNNSLNDYLDIYSTIQLQLD